MTIIERIIRMADDKRIRKVDLYKACGIPQSTFSGWTTANVTSIPSEYVVSIANLFGITCDELLTGVPSLNSLNDDEKHLLIEFNQLGWEGKQVVLGTLVNEKRRMESQVEGDSSG